jgi:hypothetical protein
MIETKKGALALIAGNAAVVLVMAIHPTGHQLSAAGSRFATIALLNTFAHTLAILALPLLFIGALALSSYLGRAATTPLVFYAFALCAGMIAAALSGYVGADILRREALETSPQLREVWHTLFRFTGVLNQAFARILVVGSAMAILLWSTLLEDRAAMYWYGVITSVATILVTATGVLRLDVHGFGAVVLLQGVWFIAAARMLQRVPES